MKTNKTACGACGAMLTEREQHKITSFAYQRAWICDKCGENPENYDLYNEVDDDVELETLRTTIEQTTHYAPDGTPYVRTIEVVTDGDHYFGESFTETWEDIRPEERA